ncbi:hypothetical protein JCM8208_005502 [Rhodotorula glutinis]
MHDDLQGTVAPAHLVQQQHRRLPHHEPFPASSSLDLAFAPSSTSSSGGLYGHGYTAEPPVYGDSLPTYSAHAPWALPPSSSAPSTSFVGAPPRTFLSTGLSTRLSPSVSPVDGLPAVWPTPSSAAPAALTVGEVLSLSSASFDDDGQRPFAPLASQAGPDGGFETEHVVEGPIGLAPRVKPFIAKLSHLLSQPHNFQDCVVWDSSGTSFIVSANDRFVGDVLPRLFGHGNTASFTRQLNVYGFRRLSAAELVARVDIDSTDGYSAWSHPDFTRDDKSTLHRMTPRPSRARQLKKAKKQALEHTTASASSTTRPRQRSTTDTTRTSSDSSVASTSVSPLYANWQPLPQASPPLAPYAPLATSSSYVGNPSLTPSSSSSGSSLFALFPPTTEATPSSNALGLLRGAPARPLAPNSTHDVLLPGP